MLIPTYQYFLYSRTLEYGRLKLEIANVIEDLNDESPKTIYMSKVLHNLVNYYTQFNISTEILIKDIERIENIKCGEYVMRNWYGEYHSSLNSEQYDIFTSDYSNVKIYPQELIAVLRAPCQ
jgi:hypothetical protein